MASTARKRALKAPAKAASSELRSEPLGVLGPLAANGQGLPTFATLDGRPVAVLALDDYRRLVSALASACAAAVPRKPKPERLGRPHAVSTIQRDPEVAAFLLDLFGRRATIETARAACLERFGAERTPSVTRITTFRLRTR